MLTNLFIGLQLIKLLVCHAHLGCNFMQKTYADITRMFVRDWNGYFLCRMEVDRVLALAHCNISRTSEFSLKLVVANWLELATHTLHVHEREALCLCR